MEFSELCQNHQFNGGDIWGERACLVSELGSEGGSELYQTKEQPEGGFTPGVGKLLL